MDKRVLEAIDLQLSNNIEKAREAYFNLLSKVEGFSLETVYINLGNIFFQEKNYEVARKYYDEALKINDENEKTYFNIAMVYLYEKDLQNSKETFEKALTLNENYLNAYINLGIVNKKLELLDEAIFCFERALDLNVNEADVYYNYANVLLKKEQYNISLIFFNRALELNSKDIHKIYYSIGLIYQHKLIYDKALYFFNKCLSIQKNYADAHFAKGTILLIQGDFKNAWQEYAYRWDATNDLKKPDYIVKWYNGENLKNKRVLVQEEQGYGDNIQFVRYLAKLVEMEAIVYFACREELHKLFRNIPNIILVSNNQTIENIDYFTSLLDLPKIFYDYQNEFLYKSSYLTFVKENIFEVKNPEKLNIGFVWRGNPIHKGDKKRSLELVHFKELFENNN